MILLICSNRGGTGKSATTINIASEFSRRGYKTLVCDFDSQANSTLGFNIYNPKRNIADILCGYHKFDDVVIKLSKNLDLLPSDVNIGILETDLTERAKANPKNIVSNFLNYNYILVDTPASYNYWNSLAIEISDYAVIPIVQDTHSIRGVFNMITYFHHHNPLLIDRYKLFFNKYDRRTIIAKHIMQEFQNTYSDKLLRTYIRQNIAVTESYHKGVPVNVYDPKSNASKDFHKLASELLNILKEDNHGKKV